VLELLGGKVKMKQLTLRIKKQLKEHPMVVERMPAILHTIYFPGVVLVEEMDKLGLSWLVIYFALKNKHLTILYPEDRMIELGEKIMKKELKKSGYYSKLIKQWKNPDLRFNKMCKKIDSISFDKLSLTELRKLYLDFIKIFRLVWTFPLTSTSLAYYADNVWIPKILEKYGKKGLDSFITLSTPLELSFIKQEEKNLIKIAIQIHEKKNLGNRLNAHANQYYWLKTTYREAPRVDTNYFLDKIKELSKNPKVLLKSLKKEELEFRKKRKLLLKENPFTKEELVFANLIALATNLQDLRKKNNLIGNYHVFRFLKAISKKVKYSFEELCYTSIREIEKILSGKKVSGLKSRTKCLVEVLETGFDKIIGGKEALKLYDILDNTDKVEEKIDEITGVIACLGKAKGIARVVPDVSKVKVFNKGDILVASMTRPEYVPLMKKAAAIITDEGGITCHAAIVSRELGIPCIIGTKIATKVLKDGDLVEVDADKGVVRILEK
jgi:phosphohistidine swiveling domain-containing protein